MNNAPNSSENNDIAEFTMRLSVGITLGVLAVANAASGEFGIAGALGVVDYLVLRGLFRAHDNTPGQ